MIPRLEWVAGLVASVNRAVDGQISGFMIEDHVDPIKKLVHIRLNSSWIPKNFNPMFSISAAFANANDCVLDKMSRNDNELVLEVLLKRRGGPRMNKNPILGDKG